MAAPVGFGRGAGFVMAGARFVFFRHPGLIRYWIFPWVINTGVFFLLCFAVWFYFDDVANWIWLPSQSTGAVGILMRGLHWVLAVVVAILMLGIAVVLMVLVGGVLAAPFYDALSEEVERLVQRGVDAPLSVSAFLRDAFRAVGLELVKLVLYLAALVPVWLLGLWLPVVGQVIATLAGFVFTVTYLALEHLDRPAARRGYSISRRLELLRTRFFAAFGFGCAVWCLMLVPLVNLLFIPVAVTGGTLLFLELDET